MSTDYCSGPQVSLILSVDVEYRCRVAFIAGLTFSNWEDEYESGIFKSMLNYVEDYLPGQFYRRELPCLLKIIEDNKIVPDTIVIDGYVYLDGKHTAGLGKHLYDAFEGKVNVVGVAKRPFRGIPAECELLRGRSRKPLYITSAGIPLEAAKANIRRMHGKHRLPDLLKKTDRLCRQSQWTSTACRTV